MRYRLLCRNIGLIGGLGGRLNGIFSISNTQRPNPKEAELSGKLQRVLRGGTLSSMSLSMVGTGVQVAEDSDPPFFVSESEFSYNVFCADGEICFCFVE